MRQGDGEIQVQTPALPLTGCVTSDNVPPSLDLSVLLHKAERTTTLAGRDKALCCGPGSARPSTSRLVSSVILSKFFTLHLPWFCHLRKVGFVLSAPQVVRAKCDDAWRQLSTGPEPRGLCKTGLTTLHCTDSKLLVELELEPRSAGHQFQAWTTILTLPLVVRTE